MRITIFIIAIVGLCAGGLLSYLDKVGSAGATYAASILCLIFVYLPEFKRFKGFGIEAELLEKKIEEADEILQRLRAVLGPMVEVLFTMVVRFGRFGSAFSRLDQYRIIKRIEDELKVIKMNNEQLDKAQIVWHLSNMWYLSSPILNHLKNSIDIKLQEKYSEINLISKPISSDKQVEHLKLTEDVSVLSSVKNQIDGIYKINQIDTIPSSIENFIKSCDILTVDEKNDIYIKYHENIDDLNYYAKNHNFRRLEVLNENE